MKMRCTARGYVGLLVGLGAALAYAVLTWASGSAASAEPDTRTSTPPPPTERIDVEQAVAFPYDI